MMVYTSTVSKSTAGAGVPSDEDLEAHHVKGKNGQHVKFTNAYPSSGVWNQLGVFETARRIIGYFVPPSSPLLLPRKANPYGVRR